jgi:histidine ammonia-lyase
VREVRLDGRSLTVEALRAVANGAPAVLAPEARDRMEESARWVADRAGPGLLATKWTWLVGGDAPSDEATLVKAFVLGHCAGVGEPLSREAVRALIAARVNVLATGHTGCRPAVADALIAMLAADVVPVVPSQGAVGAAGSPALAHVLRVACGWGGEAWRDGKRLRAAEAMAGLPKLAPNEKEALSVLNGDTLTTGLGALAVARAEALLATAEAACALTFEVVRADLGCLDPRAMEARHHPGAIAVAEKLRGLLAGSELCGVGRRPDPFSIRCAPAVLGTAREAVAQVRAVVERELNAASDNPLLFDGEAVEAGNFHGAPVATALDHLKIALTEVASISERRIFRLTYGQLSGLPSFLVPGTGLNSGLMLAQYTAASLVSECKGLAHPASVDSIPTVQHREDHVPMGPIAARTALLICEALADVLAIELLCGAQGLDFHLGGKAVDEHGNLVDRPALRPGAATLAVYQQVRERVTRWDDDRVLHPDVAALGKAVRAGVFAG